ncbi:hypothetical protein ACH419_31390 [Streptomyces bobili]|uniref:hypothetical protein n=1 Tax=Streptomyces bobili TaxID=67280 RepID=UPI0037B7D772
MSWWGRRPDRDRHRRLGARADVRARHRDAAKFAKAVQAATDHLIENGELQKILDKFNAGQGLIKKAEILPATGSN